MNHLRVGIQFVKFAPIISTLAIIFSLVITLLGSSLIYSLSMTVSTSILMCLLLYCLSKAFKFCAWHRVLIINLFFVALISWINLEFYRLPNILIIRIVLLISTTSALVATILYFKYGCFKSLTTKGN